MDIRKPTPSGKTTIGAMLLSVFAAAMVFVPWIRLHSELNGLFSWHGVVNLILLITLFLFLVATSPLKPVPLWRTFPLIGVAFLVTLFAGLFIVNWRVMTRLEAGVYLQLAGGFLLLLIGALEIRGHVIAWLRNQAPPSALPLDDFEPRRGDDDPRERIQIK
jgi:hypothetical protein